MSRSSFSTATRVFFDRCSSKISESSVILGLGFEIALRSFLLHFLIFKHPEQGPINFLQEVSTFRNLNKFRIISSVAAPVTFSRTPEKLKNRKETRSLPRYSENIRLGTYSGTDSPKKLIQNLLPPKKLITEAVVGTTLFNHNCEDIFLP